VASNGRQSPYWFARHSRSVIFLIVTLALVGTFIAFTIPVAVFPATNFPRILIGVDNGVMPIDQMMVTITRPLEEAVNSVPGLQNVRSVTSRGSAGIDLFFTWDVDMFQTLRYVNATLSRVQAELPASAKIEAHRMTFASFPIMGYSLTSNTMEPTKLWEMATYEIKPRLNRLDGVSTVVIQGGQEPEFHIIPDPAKLLVAGVTVPDILVFAAPAVAQPAPGYSVVRTMLLGGDGGWDYVYADSGARRLYIARATRFMVVDLDSSKLVAEIPDTPGAHGVALVPDLGIGFTSNGRENTSSVFDLKTLKASEKIKTGEGPDAIVYDPASGNVFTMDGHGKSASVIDPKSRKAVATIPLSGKPETPVPDGKGRMYINIESKGTIAVVDSKADKVIAEWPMAGCDEPSGLDMDLDTGNLFAACGNKLIAIVDSKTGNLITTIPTGDGSDGLAFDPKAKLAVTSNGEGNMSFVGKRGGKYALIENVAIRRARAPSGLTRPPASS